MVDEARARLKSRLTWLAGLTPLLCAAPAAADPLDVGGVGVFLGYAMGDDGGFEWGIEGFGTHHFEPHHECESSEIERRGIGPVLRLSAAKLSRLEITLAVHGGGDMPGARSLLGVDGEIGASMYLSKAQPLLFAPHSGVLVESLLFNVYFRQGWLFDSDAARPRFSLGAGGRFSPTFGLPGFCAEGRVYRDDCGQPQTARLRRHPRFDRKSPAARRWSKRAVEECASVPAFFQLALELLELGAPLALVERAVRAADEELGHTRVALQLAQQFGGAPARLVAPPFRRRPGLPRPLALERIAAEAWLDGCLNEGQAALIAYEEAERTLVKEEARACRLIAREEAGHAALAADILQWATAASACAGGEHPARAAASSRSTG